MQFAQGNNLPRVKASNQSSILQMIYHCGPIKRAEIAEQLGLTLPTITTNVNNMITQGIVRETDSLELPPGYPGRRARLVDIVPEAQHFIGVEIQGYRRVVCVLDFRGRTVCACKDETPHREYAVNMELSCAMIRRALEDSGLSLEQISGMGFCAPGLVDSRKGILATWPGYGWHNENIRADAARLTGYTGPISMENNVCARAYGARLHRRELLNNAENFAYLFISKGIACPLFLNTANAFGSIVGAGEVGHMIMEPDGLLCDCGNRGCLEAYSSNRAVISRCAEAMARGDAPVLRRLCPGGNQPGMGEILAAQAAGDRDICQIIDKAVYMLGIAVANINNFACPRIMLIEGELTRSGQNQQRLLDVVRDNLCSVVSADTEFIFVEPDEFSGARGAAARAICRSLESYGE